MLEGVLVEEEGLRRGVVDLGAVVEVEGGEVVEVGEGSA